MIARTSPKKKKTKTRIVRLGSRINVLCSNLSSMFLYIRIFLCGEIGIISVSTRFRLFAKVWNSTELWPVRADRFSDKVLYAFFPLLLLLFLLLLLLLLWLWLLLLFWSFIIDRAFSVNTWFRYSFVPLICIYLYINVLIYKYIDIKCISRYIFYVYIFIYVCYIYMYMYR